MLSKLRSICILNRQVYQVGDRTIKGAPTNLDGLLQDYNDWAFERMKTPSKEEKKKVKRRVGYETDIDDTGKAQDAMKRMRLDSSSKDDMPTDD